ncbi:MAG TPA: TonB-dependent receptor plug domain-containing protein [Terracidiphilus sp.]|nr:TonB-dependent receptor plug domain-containing protein [Terracidiphilus sp.]
MPASASLRARLSRILPSLFIVILFAASAAVCPAASIRGVVTDPAGAKVTGANVALLSNGKVVTTAVSTADGSFQILTGTTGRFFLVVSAKSFRQVETPGFYAGTLDNIERNVVLEPEWVRESIVVTATGTPTPQAQTSAATTVLGPLDLALRDDLVSDLRLMPGTFVAQDGQLGAQSSLFVRGGDSNANKILLDGVSVGDLGGGFDFGPLRTTAVERVEVYRGPDSSLYGADAESSVVSLTTPHGTTSFPSIMFQGDAGNFNTSREELEVAGAHNKFDYLGTFSWLQTGNSLPMDEYHVATWAANLGWQPNGNTQIRGTLHYGVDATGVPSTWDFYQISDDRKEGDQNLYVGATLENQTTPDFHNRLQYGLTRKREQSQQWYPAGLCIPADSCGGAPDSFTGGNYYGLPVTIQGANGYSATGPALLDYSAANGSVYPNRLDLISNRDQFLYQGDYRLTPHFVVLAGFHYGNERGAEREPAYFINDAVNWTNYDYLFGAHGDFFKERLFYTLGADVQHYQLIGNGVTPHAGLGFYAMRPRNGIFSGTRLNGSFSQGIREPKVTDDFGSLYSLLEQYGAQATIEQLHISPIEGPTTRTWEGGGEQAFWSERIVFRATYFHNEFARDIESVGVGLVPVLFPNLNAQQQMQLESTLQNNNAYSMDLNSLAFRAQGVETTVESGIGKNIFFRGGYTYLDSVVQQSFSSDNQALLEGYAPTFDGIPVGIYSPLKGARPFRRPPHAGFFTVSYAGKRIAGVFTSAFASRSDDSTFLGYEDINQVNSLVLPNRNLDFGYAKLDLGGSYQLLTWLGIYLQAENLADSQHIAPIGYPSLPATLRGGIKIAWGPGSGK